MEFATDGEEEFCVGLMGVDGETMLTLGAADADDYCAIHYEIRVMGGILRRGIIIA